MLEVLDNSRRQNQLPRKILFQIGLFWGPYHQKSRTNVFWCQADHRHLQTIVQGGLRSIRSIGRLIDWFDRFDRFDIRTLKTRRLWSKTEAGVSNGPSSSTDHRTSAKLRQRAFRTICYFRFFHAEKTCSVKTCKNFRIVKSVFRQFGEVLE